MDDDKLDGRPEGFLLMVLLLRNRQRIPAVPSLAFTPSPPAFLLLMAPVTLLLLPLLSLALASQAEAMAGVDRCGCACAISTIVGKNVDWIGKGWPVGTMAGAVPP